jgi:hypothetical protein
MTGLKAIWMAAALLGAATVGISRARAEDDIDQQLATLRSQIAELREPAPSQMSVGQFTLHQKVLFAGEAATELKTLANKPPEELARPTEGRILGGGGSHTAGWYCQRTSEALNQFERSPNAAKERAAQITPGLQRGADEYPPKSTNRLAKNVEALKQLLSQLAATKDSMQADATKLKERLNDPGLREGLAGLQGAARAERDANKKVDEYNGKFTDLQTGVAGIVKLWNDRKQQLHVRAERLYLDAPRDRQQEFLVLVRTIDGIPLPAKVTEATALVSQSDKLRDSARWNINRAFEQVKQEGKDCEKISDLAKLKQRAETARDNYASNLEAVVRGHENWVRDIDKWVEHAKRILTVDIPTKKQQTPLGDYEAHKAIEKYRQKAEEVKPEGEREQALLRELAAQVKKVGKAAEDARKLRF